MDSETPTFKIKGKRGRGGRLERKMQISVLRLKKRGKGKEGNESDFSVGKRGQEDRRGESVCSTAIKFVTSQKGKEGGGGVLIHGLGREEGEGKDEGRQGRMFFYLVLAG